MKKLSKKRKILFAVVAVLVVFSLSYVTVASMNYVPFPGLNKMIEYPDSEKIAKVTIGAMISEISLNYSIVEEIDELDTTIELEIYGIKDNNAKDVFDWYLAEYTKNGWKLYTSSDKKGKNWALYYGVWTKGIMIQATMVGEGVIVEKYTAYDVMSGSAFTNIVEINI